MTILTLYLIGGLLTSLYGYVYLRRHGDSVSEAIALGMIIFVFWPIIVVSLVYSESV